MKEEEWCKDVREESGAGSGVFGNVLATAQCVANPLIPVLLAACVQPC